MAVAGVVTADDVGAGVTDAEGDVALDEDAARGSGSAPLHPDSATTAADAATMTHPVPRTAAL